MLAVNKNKGENDSASKSQLIHNIKLIYRNYSTQDSYFINISVRNEIFHLLRSVWFLNAKQMVLDHSTKIQFILLRGLSEICTQVLLCPKIRLQSHIDLPMGLNSK